MKIIKRSGLEVDFDKNKIIKAVSKANAEIENPEERLSSLQIQVIEEKVEKQLEKMQHTATIEDIQNLVIHQIMAQQAYSVAQVYTEYRYKHALKRKANSTDEAVLSLLDASNEEIKQENSNKNPVLAPTQRDYMAGEVSKDLTKRLLLPEDIVNAHEQGLIHFHDADYFAQHIFNCDLINLEDMLQNGTVISETMIEKPHSFSTACNIATQAIAQVASSQYGGQSISLAHLSPFIQVSREKFIKEINEEFRQIGTNITVDKIKEIAEMRVKEEIKRGVQMIQYQLLTLMTTNGQTPFVSIFMNLKEVPEGQARKDLATLIMEVFRQRIQGIKNECGHWITPAFPKLLYVLSDINTYKDSPYRYVTEKAAECTAKRMVPDYISEKIMKEVKDGDVFPCMGCVEGKELVTYKIKNQLYIESFERMWRRLSDINEIKHQYSEDNPNLYMDLSDVNIYDTKEGFVKVNRIIRNVSKDWIDIHFSKGRNLLCTDDHPLTLIDGRTIQAIDIKAGDKLLINTNQYSEETENMAISKAWLLGFILCSGDYRHNQIKIVTKGKGKEEFEATIKDIYFNNYGLDIRTKAMHHDKKGNYKEIEVISKNKSEIQQLINNYTAKFGGINKANRQIPTEVYRWNKEAKLSFLAGIIDAQGYINTYRRKRALIQIGTTNKELALELTALIQTLGMPAKVYYDHYSEENNKLVRYNVEFTPIKEINPYIICKRKKDTLIRYINKNVSNSEESTSGTEITITKETEDNIAEVKNKKLFRKTMYSYDVSTESEHFEVSNIYSHNCRSFLTVDRFSKDKGNLSKAKNYKENEHKYYGRFNQGVVTINLVDVACSSGGDMDKFWEILEERLELCHKALRLRHERLKGTKSDIAPILWQYGAIARLNKGETIDKLLYDGYSTISLGYAGLYEMCKYMTGKSHTNPEAKPFAIKVMQKLNDKCEEWKAAENIDYSVYGTPLESTTYKFAKCLQNRFGIIKEVTDHNYITNSYHVNVREPINAFQKLRFESEFQKLSPGGAISYIEVPNMQNNIEAVISVLEYIYENIMYAELNTKSDYCQECGYTGEILIEEDDNHKLYWKCPNCGNTDQNKMNVARRTCGYIGTQFWNQGRTQEIKDRILHL